jgi:Fur family transcriptional regulator, ferric uptake regulator
VGIESQLQFFSGYGTRAPEEMLLALTQAGHSNTRARRAVLTALFEADGQATPAELLELGRAHHAALGLVTVYRTLEILLSLKLVRKLHLEEGCHTYAISSAGWSAGEAVDRSPHHGEHGHYIICQSCGRAVEFDGCRLDDIVARAEAQTGFRVSTHWLELFGACPECRDAANGEDSPTRG